MMEHDMREKAKNAMRLILEAARYEVEEVDDPLDLSAVRDSTCLLVLCSNEKDLIGQFDKTNYSLMIDDQEMSCKKLLFSLDKEIATENCIQWGIDEFVRYTGEAVLADILDRELALDLTPGKAKKAAVIAAAAAAAKEEEPSGITIPHLPIKITEQAAIRTAGVQGAAKLRFIPHFLFHYTSSGEQVYKDRRIPFDADGWGAINAINGIKIDMDGKLVEDTEIPGGAEVCDSHIRKDEASERIVNELIERLTQKVRIKQEKGDAIFYEEKILKPDRKNITIDSKQVYIPVWQIRGKKIVEVNAFTGELLSEPMDEGCEVF
ncbi:MAG: two-component system regulatory protein YycI [Methanoregula sp.]